MGLAAQFKAGMKPGTELEHAHTEVRRHLSSRALAHASQYLRWPRLIFFQLTSALCVVTFRCASVTVERGSSDTRRPVLRPGRWLSTSRTSTN